MNVSTRPGCLTGKKMVVVSKVLISTKTEAEAAMNAGLLHLCTSQFVSTSIYLKTRPPSSIIRLSLYAGTFSKLTNSFQICAKIIREEFFFFLLVSPVFPWFACISSISLVTLWHFTSSGLLHFRRRL